MGKAGGIVGIVAGVFGFIAAVITLFLGGVGGALQAEGASTVVGLGWGGVLFSFLSIVFGAVAFARPRGAGIGLIIVSIAGAILGGTLVAICMFLSLIGGVLATIGGGKAAPGVAADAAAAPAKKFNKWMWAGGSVAALLVVVLVLGSRAPSSSISDPIAELTTSQPSKLQVQGDLSALFAVGSRNTNLQREDVLKEITGQVVEWTLPVYEVRRSGNAYKIQTMTQVRVGNFGNDLVGTFITLTPRSEDERRQIEALRTDDLIAFKGRIAGSTLRNLNISPAILSTPASVAAAPSPRPVATRVSTSMPVSIAQPAADPTTPTSPPAPAQDQPVAAAAPAAPVASPPAPNLQAPADGTPRGLVQYGGTVSRMEVLAELSFDDKGGVSGWWTVTNDPKLRGQRFRLEGTADDGKAQLREFEGERHSLDLQLQAGDARWSSLRGKAHNRPPRSAVWEVSLVRRD